MHEVLVNRLGGLSLPRKSVVRLTDRPNMTLDVYRGRKTTMQQHPFFLSNFWGLSDNDEETRVCCTIFGTVTFKLYIVYIENETIFLPYNISLPRNVHNGQNLRRKCHFSVTHAPLK